MAVLLGFAFVSGIITILSPCILPVLPIVLSGSVGGGKARPFGIVAAFIVSFTLFTLALSAIVQAIGISPDALRLVSVVLLMIFGLVMVVPALRHRFEILASRATARTGGVQTAVATGPSGSAPGFWSGVPVGFSLGLVWTPCVGPIMASVISLALTQHVDSGSVFITLAYSIGTSIPMLAVMFGGRALLNRLPGLSRNMANIQKGFGVVMIVVGLAIAFGWDRQVQTALLRAFPSYGSGLTAIEQNNAVKQALNERAGSAATTTGSTGAAGPAEGVFDGARGVTPKQGMLADYGTAPPLITNGPWYNTAGVASSSDAADGPLTMNELKGKVVLVDFWTYSCVNCVRTIPYLRAWYDAYKDKGLVIIGVHTPEFEFEKVPRNVKAAIKDLGVTWPVVQDNNYDEWNAYHNQFWPATYFIGPNGHVRYYHFGEGDYASDEKVIQALLRERGDSLGKVVSKPDEVNYARTPETYLGYARGRGFTSPTMPVRDESIDYTSAPLPSNGQWSLSGRWTIASQYIAPESAEGTLTFRFNAKNVFLVVQPESGTGTIRVTVDGATPRNTSDDKNGIIRPDRSRLYQIVGLDKPGEHLLQLKVSEGLRLFAFTFG